MLGAGGAAQALVHRFSTENNTIKILNRTLDKARELADNTTGTVRISYAELTKDNLENGLRDTDLLVNATPIRTSTLVSQLMISPNRLKDVEWVFDLAYDKPADPVHVRRGTISPLEMLVHQAALSYEIWLNEPAPLALMRSSLVDYLGKDWK
jgi:shikimate dehydrogenase